MPKIDRSTLEFLGVCLVKLDLIAQKGKATTVGQPLSLPIILQAFAETLAPHVIPVAVPHP